jgi:hypothetical protein
MFVVKTDGTGEEQITPYGLPAAHAFASAAWSPDGSVITSSTRAGPDRVPREVIGHRSGYRNLATDIKETPPQMISETASSLVAGPGFEPGTSGL